MGYTEARTSYTRLVRAAMVRGILSTRGNNTEFKSPKSALLIFRPAGLTSAHQRFNSNYGTTGLLGEFNSRAGSFAYPAVDPHAIPGPE